MDDQGDQPITQTMNSFDRVASRSRAGKTGVTSASNIRRMTAGWPNPGHRMLVWVNMKASMAAEGGWMGARLVGSRRLLLSWLRCLVSV